MRLFERIGNNRFRLITESGDYDRLKQAFDEMERNIETQVFPYWTNVIRKGQYEFVNQFAPVLMKIQAFKDYAKKFGENNAMGMAKGFASMTARKYASWMDSHKK